MNIELLKKHIAVFAKDAKTDQATYDKDMLERAEIVAYYQSYNRERLMAMTADGIYDYLSRLWAMRIWGNKHYVVDKLIEDNGLDTLRESLAALIWAEGDIADRWNAFRSKIKGVGPAMISELLCRTHPNDYMLWNRRAYVALNYLDVKDLPRYDYQLTGDVYRHLCDVCKEISMLLIGSGFKDASLLAVDYFIWSELQVEDNLSSIHRPKADKEKESILDKDISSDFIHNDIRDKVQEIGQWLGFASRVEQRVSEGSKVDAIWQATIGNMGRVIYVFEVQTKGSIDSLMLNLLKALNNPAVQGVVAVSDREQLEKIKKHAYDVKELRDKLKLWNYEEVLKVHESLAYVNESINNLGLVPEEF